MCWQLRKFTLGHSGLGSFTVFDQTGKTTATAAAAGIQWHSHHPRLEIMITGIDKTKRLIDGTAPDIITRRLAGLTRAKSSIKERNNTRAYGCRATH